MLSPPQDLSILITKDEQAHRKLFFVYNLFVVGLPGCSGAKDAAASCVFAVDRSMMTHDRLARLMAWRRKTNVVNGRYYFVILDHRLCAGKGREARSAGRVHIDAIDWADATPPSTRSASPLVDYAASTTTKTKHRIGTRGRKGAMKGDREQSS